MLKMGLPVPPAFVITTDECLRFQNAGGVVPDEVMDALPGAIEFLEQETGMTFGGGERPLLVSVRSGAATSMPGMMDTILNLGVNADVEAALATVSGDPQFAANVHQRFRKQFEEVVGHAASADPWKQLKAAIIAVFKSWNSDRAIAYRKDRKLSDGGGTAVTVQAMVFGNLDDQSGTGVLFTRNPFSGGSERFGEWLRCGQGEDVVSGRADPLPVDDLKQVSVTLFDELMGYADKLERTLGDVQDIEFTVQSGKLWLLQTRAAKRSGIANIRLSILLVREGIIDKEEALRRISHSDVAMMLRPHIDPAVRAGATVLASGHAASPGVASGLAISDTEDAQDRAMDDEDIILVRKTTNPDDVSAMVVSRAIATEIGGKTSHAAVVSRELNVPCIVGCGIDTVTKLVGREVTLDGDRGEILAGIVSVAKGGIDQNPELALLKEWAIDAGPEIASPALKKALGVK